MRVRFVTAVLWGGVLVMSCQLPSRRASMLTPYQIEQPRGNSEVVGPKSCVVVLGAGMTDEVFYAAGWMSYFLKAGQLDFVTQGVGVGFGAYLLTLLSKSSSAHWIEYQLSKLAALDAILAEQDSWFFKSKFRDFLYKHFSELDQTLTHHSFAPHSVERQGKAFKGMFPVVEKSQAEHVLGVPIEQISVKSLPTWLVHPHAVFFIPDPLWTPIPSDVLLTRLIADDEKVALLYFPAWVGQDQHPMYSKGVLAQIKEGQADFQQFYRFSSLQVFRPVSVKQRGFSAHRQLFLQGQSDAADADLSLCQNNK